MKKIYFLIVIMLLALSINSNAQLNYLFSATSKPYVPLEDGIAPHLIMVPPFNANPPWTLSDEGFAHVPVGFTFNYNGKDYDSVTICANGFVTLGDTIFRRVSPLSLYRNFLASGPFPVDGIKPVLAPFWDDLDIVDTLNLVYKTTGHFPFRVFTVEWKKTKWTFESTEPALSMELKLYEKTNIIEFHYRDEGGTPFTPRAFASIGITSSYKYRGFISLQNASSNPSISLLRANDSITVKPADNQVYRFIPAIPRIPDPFWNSVKYTNNKVSFKLKSGGFNLYEYAVTQSPVPPSSGTRTFSPNVTVSSLSPATTYYIYARTKWFGWFNSQWTCDSFRTAITPEAPPYHISGNPVNPNFYPYWPPDIRIQDINDTGFYHNPNSDANWNVLTDFPDIADTSIWALNTYQGYSADSWLFTPGLKLSAGKTYQLSFGYSSFFFDSPVDKASFEVKWGTETGAAAMTLGTLFKKDDITFDFDWDFIGPYPFNDTTILFTPGYSGNYYFGFHNLTPFTGEPGALPIIGNISISEKAASTATPFVLAGETNNTDNVLNWTTKNNKHATDFVLQKGTDGINFTTISKVPVQSLKKNPASSHANFRIQRNAPVLTSDNSKDKDAILFDESKSLFEFRRSDVGINFQKPAALTNKIDSKKNYDYIDRDAKGLNYYRLQQVDKNGKVSYSNIVALNNNAVTFGFKAYPDPARDVLNVRMHFDTNKEMNLLVTDVSGRTVLSKVIQGIKGETVTQFDVSHLAPGTYFLKLICAIGCEKAIEKFEKR